MVTQGNSNGHGKFHNKSRLTGKRKHPGQSILCKYWRFFDKLNTNQTGSQADRSFYNHISIPMLTESVDSVDIIFK